MLTETQLDEILFECRTQCKSCRHASPEIRVYCSHCNGAGYTYFPSGILSIVMELKRMYNQDGALRALVEEVKKLRELVARLPQTSPPKGTV